MQDCLQATLITCSDIPFFAIANIFLPLLHSHYGHLDNIFGALLHSVTKVKSVFFLSKPFC
jgi:hypothetical protein